MDKQAFSTFLIGLLFLTLTFAFNVRAPGVFAEVIHDVAVSGVSPDKSSIEAGYDPLTVTVDLENQGTWTETVNLTVYLDSPNHPGGSIFLDMPPSPPPTWAQVTFYVGMGDVGTWDLVASLEPVEGETDLADNTVVWGKITVYSSSPLHNIAVTGIEVPKTVLRQGSVLPISTIVGNTLSFFNETFDLTLYANETIIGTSENITLAPDSSANITLVWDTSGFAHAYVISANITLLEGEADFGDNILIYGIVNVSCLGDINGDYVTDAKDFVLVKKAIPSMPSSPNWNPNADMNDDGVVDAKDYQIVKNHIPSVFP